MKHTQQNTIHKYGFTFKPVYAKTVSVGDRQEVTTQNGREHLILFVTLKGYHVQHTNHAPFTGNATSYQICKSFYKLADAKRYFNQMLKGMHDRTVKGIHS